MTSLPSLTSTSIPSLFELCLSVITQTNQVFASVNVPTDLLEKIFKRAKELGLLNKNNFLHFINAYIEHVDLRGIHSVGDDDIFVIAKRCHQLKSLKLNSFVTQDSLEYLFQNCTTLEKLDLRSQQITNVKALQTHPISYLTSLTICGNLTTTSFEDIITSYTNLKVLKMQTTNDLTLSNLTIKLPHLEKLKLSYSQKKTSSNSSTQSDNTTNSTSQDKIHPLLIFGLTCCPSLKSLELHDLHSFTSLEFLHIDKKLLNSLNCTNLTRLVLRSNYSIDVDLLPFLFQKCPNLQTIEGLLVTHEQRKTFQIFPTFRCPSCLVYFSDLKHYMNVLSQWKMEDLNRHHQQQQFIYNYQHPNGDDVFGFAPRLIFNDPNNNNNNNNDNNNNNNINDQTNLQNQMQFEENLFPELSVVTNIDVTLQEMETQFSPLRSNTIETAHDNNNNNNIEINNNNDTAENFRDDANDNHDRNDNQNNNIAIRHRHRHRHYRNQRTPARLLHQNYHLFRHRQRQRIHFVDTDTDNNNNLNNNNNEQNSQRIEYIQLVVPFERDIQVNDLVFVDARDMDMEPTLDKNFFLTNPFNISKMFLFSTPLRNAVQNNLVKELHLINCSIFSYNTIVTTYPHLELLEIRDVITDQRSSQGEIVQFSSLKKLVFSGSDFNDICPICPTITELVVDIDSIATRNTIVLSKILQHFPELKIFKSEKRSDTVHLENRKVTFILWDKEEPVRRNKELPSSFTTLESLFLIDCKIPQDANLSIFKQLKQLKMLNCRVECDICLGPAMEQFICTLVSSSQNPLHIDIQTQQLSHLECNRPVDYKTLSTLLTQKRLNTLILPFAPFSREMLEYLLTKQLCLTNFQCRIEVELDTVLMCQLITRWPSLKFSQRRLDFASQFPQITTEQFKKIYAATNSVKYLDLSHCTRLTSDILSLLRLRQLQVLKLNFVNFVVEMETLPQSLQHFEAISSQLQLCQNLFIWRLQEWPSLKIFKIAGAKGVYLDTIICPPFQEHNLEDLDVCGLDFSDRHVEGVLKMFPKLQRLNVTGCSLSESSLVRLRNAVKCVITDMNTCHELQSNKTNELNFSSRPHLQTEVSPTSKAPANQRQTNTSHSSQTLQECDDFQYLDITEYSADPSKPIVRLQIKLFDDHTILKVLFNEHHTPQHVYALVQRACRWGDQTFDLYCYPNKLLSRTDSRTLGELKLNNRLLMQTIRKLTEDEKKILEERFLMGLRITGFTKQTRHVQENEKHREDFTGEEKSSNESKQDDEEEEDEENYLSEDIDDSWIFGFPENKDTDSLIYDEEKAVRQAILNDLFTIRRQREEEKQRNEKIPKIEEKSSINKSEEKSMEKQQKDTPKFKENIQHVSREWKQPRVENDVDVAFTQNQSDVINGSGWDDEDDPLLQIAIAESTNINRQQNTSQTDIDMSSTNYSHLNDYSILDLSEEEQLALALSLSAQEFEAKQLTNE